MPGALNRAEIIKVKSFFHKINIKKINKFWVFCLIIKNVSTVSFCCIKRNVECQLSMAVLHGV